MNMTLFRRTSVPLQAGFSLLELMIVCAILSIVMIAIVRGIDTTVQRSEAEQVKVDLTQSGREFVDEFERDLHQAGYPNCRMVTTAGSATACPADYSAAGQPAAMNPALAVGLVYVSSTKIIFEGAMDGTGTVYSVQYRLVDAAGNNPPLSCPCILQRSEQAKNPAGALPLLQPTFFSQELQNVVNSGNPVGVAPYGGGVLINGSTAWGSTNDAYYAAIASFRDYPVFQAYDQSGTIISINPAIDLSVTPNATQILTCSVSSVNCVKSIRLTINLLANPTTGADLQTKVRPVTTLVGNARLVNN
jgi:prepilin-type N-terminal cleavage/methylation domain-containing protein